MPQTIHTLLTQYLLELKKIYGTYLKSVILYGSYARGDYTSDSDIDIMLLVDLSPEEMMPILMNYQSLVMSIMLITISG